MTGSASEIVAASARPVVGPARVARVITALVCLGILCVGASAYLVALTVQYFEGIVGSATQKSDDAVALALPFCDGYVKARKEHLPRPPRRHGPRDRAGRPLARRARASTTPPPCASATARAAAPRA